MVVLRSAAPGTSERRVDQRVGGEQVPVVGDALDERLAVHHGRPRERAGDRLRAQAVRVALHHRDPGEQGQAEPAHGVDLDLDGRPARGQDARHVAALARDAREQHHGGAGDDGHADEHLPSEPQHETRVALGQVRHRPFTRTGCRAAQRPTWRRRTSRASRPATSSASTAVIGVHAGFGVRKSVVTDNPTRRTSTPTPAARSQRRGRRPPCSAGSRVKPSLPMPATTRVVARVRAGRLTCS